MMILNSTFRAFHRLVRAIICGGSGDIRKHIASHKHKRNVELEQRALQGARSITTMMKKDDFSIIRAEVTFTDFLVEHSIPLAVSDHAGRLFRKIFPGSPIAQQYECTRTKPRNKTLFS